MGAYLSEPVTDKSSIEEKGELVSYGASAMQGWRTTQEDSHNCIPNFDKDGSLFAVYDGHGGAEVALYCSIHLPDYIKAIDSFKQGNIAQALEDAFLGFDESLTRPEVKAELKQLAGKHVKNPEEADENELDNLYAEANMPLEDVLSKYNSAFTLQVARLKGQKTSSPYICSKDKVASKIKTEIVNESESVDKDHTDVAKQAELSNGVTEENSENVIKKEIKSEEVVIEKKEPVKSEPASSSSSSSNDDISSIPGCSSDQPGSSSGSSNSRSCKSRAVSSSEVNEDDTSSSEDETYEEIQYADSETDEDGEKEDGEKIEDDEEEEEEEDDDDDDDEEEEDDDDEEDEEETEEEIDLDLQNEPGSDSGCTAVVAVVKGTELYVANAGDSRCVVCRNGKAIDMSVDHKPEEEIEMKRIVNAGGRVTSDGRVNGGLNLSRAIGDHTYKQNKSLSLREQMITSLPDIRTLTLDPKEDEFMVLACDGIWNYMKSQEVVDFVKERLDKHSLSTICELLFDLCLAPNTHGDGTGCDNMTAIVVRFHSSLGKLRAEVGNAKRKLENGDLLEQSDSKRVKTNDEDAN